MDPKNVNEHRRVIVRREIPDPVMDAAEEAEAELEDLDPEDYLDLT